MDTTLEDGFRRFRRRRLGQKFRKENSRNHEARSLRGSQTHPLCQDEIRGNRGEDGFQRFQREQDCGVTR